MHTHHGVGPVAYLQLQDGSCVMGKEPIVQALDDYYQDLYRADLLDPRADLSQFVQDLLVCSLSEDDRESLEADITAEDLRMA
ncbi:hypothetical protein NDU88_006607 [Pleurodeles waltl]|uniref:Uncharacterized protein n=1 Tax=Pleurodeles waltl TaxID=8319 RepID=A0AAV7QJJ4_PLEWA|nr:hypothetical protein NDU88_006607 [Pleurodeles waltl]